MSLNKSSKQLFLYLSKSQSSHWKKRKKVNKKRVSKWFLSPNSFVKVEIINAVTGEKTTAKIQETSKLRVKRWLRLRNFRAQFYDMVIKPSSTWAKMTEKQWKNFPVIVRLGSTQFPYIIDYLGVKFTDKKQTLCSLFLNTINNIDYLTVITEKEDEITNLLKKSKKK